VTPLGHRRLVSLVTTPRGHRLLLVWRTETLFRAPERRRLAEEWTQVRLTSAPGLARTGPLHHRLNARLPFADASFDGVYSFHVIEHLSPSANENFAADVQRLLKPGGVYRASTPDLEFLATEYLQRLHEQMATVSTDNYARYRWAVCNLIDQCVREVTGGEMLQAIRRGEFTPEHVKQMNGDSLDFLFQAPPVASPPVDAVPRPRIDLRELASRVRDLLRRRSPPPPDLQVWHEKNLWLFDRLSLGRLLSSAGFREITTVDHRTSRIPEWDRYDFDQSTLGCYPLEPSLFIEGIR
jgi:predicted SAM-dependent methyltransferase